MKRQEEIKLKREKIKGFLDSYNLDGIWLTSQANFAWYTAGGEDFVSIASVDGVAKILVTREEDFIVADNIETPRIKAEETKELDFEFVSFPWYDQEKGNQIITELEGGRKIVSDKGEWASLFNPLRYSLCEAEVERYRWLGAECTRSIASICHSINPGETENEIAGHISFSLYAKGITPIVLLVAADDRISLFRHPLPKEKAVEKKVMVVVCSRWKGLIVSLTRLVSFTEIPEKLRRKHQAVAKIDATFIAETLPGASIKDIFKSAVESYRDTGYSDEWKLHHQGGGTGYTTRDFRANLNSSLVVQQNQAFAWNPSIAGTKSEDTIIALPEGPEAISTAIDWPFIEVQVKGGKILRPDILVL